MYFGSLIVDPPWNYRSPESPDPEQTGYASQKYETLSDSDLQALPVPDILKLDAVVALWTTNPMLPQALALLDAWRLTYVTSLTWVKVVKGSELPVSTMVPVYPVGWWFRGCTEHILIAKGSKAEAPRTHYQGLISNSFGHSRKPESLHQLAEEWFPEPRLELFARRHRPGWYALGNDLPGDGADIRERLPELINQPEQWQRFYFPGAQVVHPPKGEST